MDSNNHPPKLGVLYFGAGRAFQDQLQLWPDALRRSSKVSSSSAPDSGSMYMYLHKMALCFMYRSLGFCTWYMFTWTLSARPGHPNLFNPLLQKRIDRSSHLWSKGPTSPGHVRRLRWDFFLWLGVATLRLATWTLGEPVHSQKSAKGALNWSVSSSLAQLWRTTRPPGCQGHLIWRPKTTTDIIMRYI